MTKPRGILLTFEGTDGSGKSTQMRRLIERLRSEGFNVLETVEPGGTPIGVQIRRILLNPANAAMASTTEMLLYFASRAQNVSEWIVPALELGKIVVCDRFTDSTLAYQGAGRGLNEAMIRTLHGVACGELNPDLTVYLDLDLETAISRARARNAELGMAAESRLDDESMDFHRRVREGYLRLAISEPARFRVIDARPDVDTVEKAIWEAVAPSLEGVRVR